MRPTRRLLRLAVFAGITILLAITSSAPGFAQPTLSSGPLLVNQGSNMCLGVPGATFDSGAQLVQWYCNGSGDQNWLFDSNSAFDSGGQTYTRLVDQLTGQCISVAGGSFSPGAAVVQWPCYGGADQYWTLVNVGGVFFQLVNFNSGMCLGVAGGSLSPGGQAVQWPCYGPPDQHWSYPAPGRPRISNDFTILVNGSFNPFPDWMDPSNDEFVVIGNTFGGLEIGFHWSGDDVVFPFYSSIFGAAPGLVDLINSHYFAPGEKLNIVAHSHGGNVVKIATLSSLSHPIDNLINLGTPQNFDLPPIDISNVINYCQVSSVADFTQFAGASPLRQIQFFTEDEIQVGRYLAFAVVDSENGDDDLAEFDLEQAALYEEDAAFWFFSTKIDPFANNVLFGTESHSDLHTVPVWNILRYACGLPN